MIWLWVMLLCSPMVLMILKPGCFTVGLRFVLRYNLELALPVFMHAVGLWVVYGRRSSKRGRLAFATFVCISVVSFGWLATTFTYRVFWAVTVTPVLYVILSDLLIGKSRLLAKSLD